MNKLQELINKVFKKEKMLISQQPGQQTEFDLAAEKMKEELLAKAERSRELAELNVLDAKLLLEEISNDSIKSSTEIGPKNRMIIDTVKEYLEHNLNIATSKDMTPTDRIENLSHNSFFKTINRSLLDEHEYGKNINPNVSPDNPAYVDTIAQKVFYEKFDQIRDETDERVSKTNFKRINERTINGKIEEPISTEQRHAEAKESAINYLKKFTKGNTNLAIELLELLNTKQENFSADLAIRNGHNPAFLSTLRDNITISVWDKDGASHINEDSKICGYIKKLASSETLNIQQKRMHEKNDKGVS